MFLCHRCHSAYKYQTENKGEIIFFVKELHDVASEYNSLKDDYFPECQLHHKTR